jgi:hypothetical protein
MLQKSLPACLRHRIRLAPIDLEYNNIYKRCRRDSILDGRTSDQPDFGREAIRLAA